MKQVRLFLKEFYRALQGAYFSQFSSALFEALKSYNGPHVATIFYSCLDLFSMLPFLAINSPIRDAAQVRRNSGNLSTAQTNILDRFQQQFQRFTLEAISAIKWTIQNFRIESTTFVDSLQTVLYLRPVLFCVLKAVNLVFSTKLTQLTIGLRKRTSTMLHVLCSSVPSTKNS